MKKSDKLLGIAGLLGICLLMVPWLILGEGAVVTYHDQLDGEMIAYILQAKHLVGENVLPEFMNGASKTALTPPAPASVLLFLAGKYEAALWVMQLLGSLLGYVGMFLLAREVCGRSLPAFVAGCMYGALPFLPVYGFSQYGLPLLLWCFLQIGKGQKKLFGLVYAFVFAVNSSLVLVGFAVLASFAVWIVADWCRKTCNRSKGRVLMAAVLLLGYLLVNIPLIGQMLGVGERIVSHKTEYALVAESVPAGWMNGFLYGGQHSQDYHLVFLISGIVVLGLTVSLKTERARYIRKWAVGALICNGCFAAAAALWNGSVGVMLRANLGALGALQADRFLWLAPCLWYLFLACQIGLLTEFYHECRKKEKKVFPGMAIWSPGALVVAVAVCICGVQILKNSDFKSNIQKLRNPDYAAMSYEDYYAIGVYEQVAEFMDNYTGRDRSEYRVVSLGIDPAAALYHGFYCLDGYSNNYSLEYKHAFRKVIAPALEESEYLRDYYDNWGNRCYVFGSECPGYYTIEKNGFFFEHLELDSQALSALGGEYLFSAAYIANAEELGLTLLREDPFETQESYYRIFVYQVG